MSGLDKSAPVVGSSSIPNGVIFLGSGVKVDSGLSSYALLVILYIPNNSNIEKVRDILTKIISEKHSKSNLENLPKTAAFFSEKDERINDNYKLKDKEFISIIPPIGGG